MTSGSDIFRGPLQPAVRSDADSYLTTEDLLLAQDRTAVDVRVPWWGGRIVRVQALTLEQQERVLRAARIAAAQYAKDGDPAAVGPAAQDWMTYIVETIREAMVVPRLTPVEALQLRHKNPRALEELARFIWSLSALSQENIDAIVRALTPAADPGDAARPGGAAGGGA